MSGSFGSTVIFSKYQPRPQSALSPFVLVQVSPPSSDRNTPPCPGGGCVGAPAGAGTGGGVPRGGSVVGGASGRRQSTTAYTRFGLLAAIAIPVLPIPVGGKPDVSRFHVVPPSVDLKIPPPGPFVGAYVNHG